MSRIAYLMITLLLVSGSGAALISVVPTDLGNTQEQFWKGLREKQAQHAPNWGESIAVQLDSFTEREALDVLAQHYLSVAGAKAIKDVGWSSIESIPEPYTEALIIGLPRIPIFDEPKFLSDHLKVYGLAREGDALPIVGEELVPVRGFSLSVGPMDAGEWVQVLTKNGARGWVRRDGSVRTAIMRAPQISTRPTNIDSSPAQVSRTRSWIPIVLGGVLLALLVLWRLSTSRNRPRLAPSQFPGDSTRHLSSDLDEFIIDLGEESGEEGWFHNLFKGRTSSMPRQRWYESNRDYRDSIYLKGRESILMDTTGSEPKQRWFEGDDEYKGRIAQEANECIVEEATGSAPKQGWFESDDEYRGRISLEANERIVEGATGSDPRQGWFESDDEYGSRISQEANEHIIEQATGSTPKQGWFESDEDYHSRITREANEVRASRRD